MDSAVRVAVHGVPDRIHRAGAAREQLALCRARCAGIARARARAPRDRGDRRVIRLGVVGHRGYDGLPAVLERLIALGAAAAASTLVVRGGASLAARQCGAARAIRCTSTRCSRSAATARCSAARGSSRGGRCRPRRQSRPARLPHQRARARSMEHALQRFARGDYLVPRRAWRSSACDDGRDPEPRVARAQRRRPAQGRLRARSHASRVRRTVS